MEEVKGLIRRAQVMNSMIAREMSELDYDASPAEVVAKAEFISNLAQTMGGLLESSHSIALDLYYEDEDDDDDDDDDDY